MTPLSHFTTFDEAFNPAVSGFGKYGTASREKSRKLEGAQRRKKR
jgi:hypothetical protein